MAELIIVDSSQKVNRYPMQKDEAVIGRSEDCDIQIDDPMISRYHAKVSVSYFIQDIGSTNGIWKEGKRFKKTTIAPGEEVFLGKSENYQLRLEAGSPPAAEPDIDQTIVAAPEPAKKAPAPPKADDAGTAQMKARLEQAEAQQKQAEAQLKSMKGRVEQMTADLERAKAESLRLEKSNKGLKEENRFLRGALYPDGAPPDLEEFSGVEPEVEDVAPPPPKPLSDTVSEPAAAREADEIPEPAAEAVEIPEPVEIQHTPMKEEVDYSEESAFADDAFLRELLDIYVSDSGLAVELRDSTREDLLFTLKALQKWGRDVERVTTRVAQEYAGVHGPMETMLPEVEHNITSLVNDLLSKGSPERRRKLEEYLVRLRTWYVACLGGYRKALEKWCHDFLTRLSPGTIKSKKQYNVLVRTMGLDELFYWKLFEETMRNVNVPTMMEEFEELAAKAAVEIATKDEKDPLGMGSQMC